MHLRYIFEYIQVYATQARPEVAVEQILSIMREFKVLMLTIGATYMYAQVKGLQFLLEFQGYYVVPRSLRRHLDFVVQPSSSRC